jgi:4-amino-4-deoxy-L-arabinose transferase-like glycosyltransferase
MKRIISERLQLVALLLVALALYVAYAPFYYVGFYNDDAVYVLLARSLLAGKYVALYRPGQPPFTLYPPGFPFLLAPVVKATQPHWAWLKLIMIGIAGGNGFLVWKLYQTWLPARFRMWAVALFVCNPSSIFLSSAVMADSFFLTTLLATLLLLIRLIKKRDHTTPWLLGITLGAHILVKSMGVILILPILIATVYASRARDALKTTGTAVVIGGCFFLRNYLLTHKLSEYAAAIHGSLSDVSLFSQLFDNVQRVTYYLFLQSPLGVALPHTPLGISISFLLTAVLLYGIGRAWTTWKTGPMPARALCICGSVYVLLTYGVLSLWTAISSRYTFPALPFLLAFYTLGFAWYYERATPMTRRVGVIVGCLFLLLYARADAMAYKTGLEKSRVPDGRCPMETWSWINRYVPARASFVNPKAAEVYLYTQRTAVGLLHADSSEEFRYAALKMGATHLLARPFAAQTSGRDEYRAWLLNQYWAASWPQAFKPVYSNASEGTTIYEVLPDPDYVKAYELYESAREDLNRSSIESGLHKLDQALALDPTLTSALNAYGAAYLLSGKNLHHAESKLKKAVDLRPNNALALLNLARVYRQLGRRDLTRRYLQQAESAIQQSGEYLSLAPVVESELGAR